ECLGGGRHRGRPGWCRQVSGLGAALQRLRRRAVIAVVDLPLGAEQLVEVPAGREVERQLRARQPGALWAGWCRIDGHQACQAADEMMLKRKPKDAVIGLLGGSLV